MSSKILFLEDDLLLGETVVDLLEDAGYEVQYCTNGQQFLDLSFTQKFSLYLLDINVPIISGIELLQELRASEDKTPAIFLTSHKEKEMLSLGFSSGADDYIKKPFDSDELLLRIAALLKRYEGEVRECRGNLCHDKVQKRIYLHTLELDISQKEYQLLALLMKHSNKIVTKEMILDELYHGSDEISEGAVRVYINRIKHVLDEGMIENIRGVGYKLVC